MQGYKYRGQTFFWVYKRKLREERKRQITKLLPSSVTFSVLGTEGWGGEKKKVITTCKLKNLHSCLVLTSRGTAACGAVVLSWPARNTWPAPPAIGRATAKKNRNGRRSHHKQEKYVASKLKPAILWAGVCQPVRAPANFPLTSSVPPSTFKTSGANHEKWARRPPQCWRVPR